MKSYKDPSFQDRISRATEAKQKALDALRTKPPIDEELVAARKAARLRREAAEAEKRAAKLAAREEAARERAAKAAKPERSRVRTEDEAKAARDARYAARKNRK